MQRGSVNGIGETRDQNSPTNRKTRLTFVSNYAISIPVVLVLLLLVTGFIFRAVVSSDDSQEVDTFAPVASFEGTESLDPGSGSLSQLIVESIVQVIIIDSDTECAVGSGSVVIDGTYVLTNHHVVAKDSICSPDKISIRTVATASSTARETHVAEIIASDEIADIAILRIEPVTTPARTMKPLTIVRSDEVGQDLTIVGFPAIGGNSATVSRGILSGFKTINGIQWMKTDALISGGNSGGAALNENGALLGIPTMYSESDSGDIVDCRNAADTNGDGRIDSRDQCVTTGGTIGLIAPASAIESLLRSIGLDVRGQS